MRTRNYIVGVIYVEMFFTVHNKSESRQKRTHRQVVTIRLTSEGSVSSTRMFGPVVSGPNAQMDLAASRSQSYFVWKNSPSFFLS